MSRNEFAMESCMNFGMMLGRIIQFVIWHLKINVWFLTMVSRLFLNNVQSMFSGASSFNSDVSSWNTSKVTSMRVSKRGMRDMFGVCFCVWWVQMNLMWSHVWTLEWCQVVFFNLCCDIFKMNVWFLTIPSCYFVSFRIMYSSCLKERVPLTMAYLCGTLRKLLVCR